MARFEARQLELEQAELYPRAPDPQALGDLVSLVLGKNSNPLLPPTSTSATTTLNDIPIDGVPATTTAVTNLPVVTTTVVTTGNDGQPTTVIRTDTETRIVLLLPTTTNGNGNPNNPAVSRATGTGSSNSVVPNHTNASPGSNSRNGDNATPTASGVAGGTSMVESESAPGVALKASLGASKNSGCVSSSCDSDWQFGTTKTMVGTSGSSPTGGNTQSDRPDGDISNLGGLIGGVVGAVIGVVLVVLVVYFSLRRARRRRAAARSDSDATGLLDDADPFRFMHPRSSNRESRMTIDTMTQLQRSPSFGTLYGLRYNGPEVAGAPTPASGSVLGIGNLDSSRSAPHPIMQWKLFTPSKTVPHSPGLQVGPESPICPNSLSGSGSIFESDIHTVRVGGNRDGTSADRPTLGVDPDRLEHCRSPSLSASVVAAGAENPFAAEGDLRAPERGT